MERDIKRALLLTLSSPLKPGALHRLTYDYEYELRLYEALEVLELLGEARQRGQQIALGKVSGSEAGLGSIMAKAVIRAFEASGLKPLTGLWTASVAVAAIDGYASAANLRVSDSLHVLITRVLYSATGSDASQLLEALSDVADSELVSYASDRGLSPNYVTSSSMGLGDLFEVLSNIDTGFMLNLKRYEDLLHLSKELEASKTVYEGLSKAYLELAGKLLGRNLIGSSRTKIDTRWLASLDRDLQPERQKLNRALGGLFVATYLSLVDGRLPPFSAV